MERRRKMAVSGIRVAQEREVVVWRVVSSVWVAVRVASRNWGRGEAWKCRRGAGRRRRPWRMRRGRSGLS